MLEKMGWSEGKGLGKEGNGQLSHVVIKKKDNNLGLGVDDNNVANKHFKHTELIYSDILKQLNNEHSKERDVVEKSIKRKRKVSIDNGDIKKVYKLHKSVKNKNVKNYSSEDLNVILGTPHDLDEDEQLYNNNINNNEIIENKINEDKIEKKNKKHKKDNKKDKDDKHKKEKKNKEKEKEKKHKDKDKKEKKKHE